MKSLNFFLISLTLSLVACSQPESSIQKEQMVTQKIWKELVAEDHNPQILDVRTAEEFAEGHVHGAVNMDFYANDFMDQVNTLHKDHPVYIYCHSGGRSARAIDLMSAAGFNQVYDLQGGFSSWED